MAENKVSLQLTYNIDKSVITFKGFDALGKETATRLPLSLIAQMETLFREGTIAEMLRENTHKKVIKVPHYVAATNTYLKQCGSTHAVGEMEDKARQIISKEMRLQVWSKYNGESSTGVCYVCGKHISILTWDASHVVSDFQGGNVTLPNLRPCCIKCNRSMGDQNLYVYIMEQGKQGPGRKNVQKYFDETDELYLGKLILEKNKKKEGNCSVS
jgi:hypothetical protein